MASIRPAGEASTSDSGAGARAPRKPLSPRRKWIYRIAAMTVIPAGLFLLLECGLRLFGYGYQTDFSVKSPERDAYVANEKFGWRFFPPHLARTPQPFLLPAHKPPRTFRIFVLGGSAALGVPDPAFSFGRVLEAMLEIRYPEVRFEVINAAMSAINSHVVLPIARDCARHQPDLFIVYMGNNEVVGPYGPGTIFGGLPSSLAAIRLSLWTRSTRTGQLIGNLIRKVGKTADMPAEWRGMAMFAENRIRADDPRLERAYGYFRRNLIDICAAARRAGAEAIVCTVATNLADSAPFASLHRADLGQAERNRWEGLYRRGIERESEQDYAGAVEQYQAAAKIDDRFADLHFRLGRCYRAMGKTEAARDHFVLARDLDALRFRADTRINRIIRQVAGDASGGGVHLADVERAFERNGAIPGREVFYEHVHLNFDGNYLAARAVFAAASRIVAERMPGLAAAAAEPPPISRCAKRLGLTGWDRYRHLQAMAGLMSRAPFTNQLDYDQQQERVRQALADLKQYAEPQALAQAQRSCQAAIRERPEDWYLYGNLEVIQEQRGDYAGLEQTAQKIIKLAPHAWAYYARGHAQAAQRKAAEAVVSFRQALERNPYLAEAHSELGRVLYQQGRKAEGIEHLRRALALRPGYVQASVSLATALMRDGQFGQAIQGLREALARSPDEPPLLDAMVTFLVKCPDPQWRNAREAVRLAEHGCRVTRQRDPRMLLGLAAAYGAAGRLADAADAARRAADLFAAAGQTKLAAQIIRELQLYQRGTPRNGVPQIPVR